MSYQTTTSMSSNFILPGDTIEISRRLKIQLGSLIWN